MSQHSGKPSPIKTKPIPTYFSQSEKRDRQGPKPKSYSKMAESGGGVRADAEVLTKAYLVLIASKIEGLETELSNKLLALIKPLSEQIEQLHLSILNVSKVAEGAMDLSLTQQEEIKGLQGDSEEQAERLAILNNRQRFFNLKFRGIKEKAEEDCDLIT